MRFLGFEIKRLQSDEDEVGKSFAPPQIADGAEVYESGIGFGSFVHSLDFNTVFKNDEERIKTYRTIAQITEVSDGIDDIINEAIVMEDDSAVVEINLDRVNLSDSIKKKIRDEFENVLTLLDFNNTADIKFREWYIDGRQYYHIITNDSGTEIIELRPLDSTKIKKIRNIKKSVRNGVEYIDKIEEFYTYKQESNTGARILQISPEAILEVTSGVVDPDDGSILSHLHRAIRPANQLKHLEDSLVVHRVARSPQRRVFYVDVGKLPRSNAEKYLSSVIEKFKNKIVYDSSTGSIKSENAHHSMLEDIFLPRKEGSRGTEVSTLDGASNLGDIEDVLYFRKKLYKALHIPVSRLEQETAFTLGRANEITRDELKFTKFIRNLRAQYSILLKEALKRLLIIKKIITEDDWDDIVNKIDIKYASDSQFAELKELEILGERLNTLSSINDYIGKFFSMEYVRKRILHQSDDEIESIKKQIDDEKKSGEIKQEDDSGF